MVKNGITNNWVKDDIKRI